MKIVFIIPILFLVACGLGHRNTLPIIHSIDPGPQKPDCAPEGLYYEYRKALYKLNLATGKTVEYTSEKRFRQPVVDVVSTEKTKEGKGLYYQSRETSSYGSKKAAQSHFDHVKRNLSQYCSPEIIKTIDY